MLASTSIQAQNESDIKDQLKDISKSSVRLIERGNKLFNNYAYDEAIKVYLRATEKEAQSLDLFANLADSYYENADMANAVNWYKSLVDFDLPSVKGEYYFRYSQALKAIGDYTNSDLWLGKLAELNSDDSRAASFKYDPEYLKKVEVQSNRYDIAGTSINTEHSEFAAGYGDRGVIFSSDRHKGAAVKRIHTWTGNPFLELFSAEISEDNGLANVKKLKGDFNSKFNESTVAITSDGNTMYFTRNSFAKGDGYQKDQSGITRLKLYRATKVKGSWKNIIEFPYNNTSYSVAHPTLSRDDKKLYFASDMPGTYGLSDIYYVDINEDGGFGSPQNLGEEINTEGRDTFPFIAKDERLYFSSDGHLGLGGLDVFVSLDPQNPTKDQIYNVGRPINSEKDDFAFIMDTDTKLGYFTSNRDSGAGGDDIYQLLETKPLVIDCEKEIAGITTNKNTGDIIPNATLTIYDSNNTQIHKIQSDDKGAFSFKLDCTLEATYRVVGEKDTFTKDEQTFDVEPNVELALELALNLEPEEPVVAIGTDLFKLLNLNPIYFNYDKAFIRDDAEIELAKIIRFMNENTSVKIDVRSHTDSRGRDEYNLNLSKRRNTSTIDYIINRGNISRSRITGRGYGETQLQNRCSNGVKCSKEEHQLNRRSEFIVVAN